MGVIALRLTARPIVRGAGAGRVRGLAIALVATLAACLVSLGPTAPPATAGSIAAGADGNMWFVEDRAGAGNRIGRITPAGVLTWFPTAARYGVQPRSIGAGPDGNLWFTELYGNRIGRATTSGVVTIFPTGMTRRMQLADIAGGRDGNVWFTADSGRRSTIGRVTPEGRVSLFSAGISQGNGLGSIVAGPDGNLWFTEYGADRIGRITLDGAVTEFRVPDSLRRSPSYLASPSDLAAGPDGQIWLSTSIGLGRVAPSGAVTAVFLGRAVVETWGSAIAWGRDGRLWFGLGREIARLSPDRELTTFAVPSPRGGEWDIAAGPDGNLWFTGSGAVGRITPSGIVSEFPPSPSVTLRQVGGRAIAAALRCPAGATAACVGTLVLDGGGWRGPVRRFVLARGRETRVVSRLRPRWTWLLNRGGAVDIRAWIRPRPLRGSAAMCCSVLAGQLRLSAGR